MDKKIIINSCSIPGMPLPEGVPEPGTDEFFDVLSKQMRPLSDIEKALQKKFRKNTFSKFTKALVEYQLIEENDRIAVAISGGKDSLMLAKMFQALHKFSDFPFELKFIAMDPGFAPYNRKLLEFNCNYLNIPVKIYNSDVFEVADAEGMKSPCYMCARMRRGFLYSCAEKEGCNKIALGHHFNDVIETTLLNVLWSANYKNMMPKLKSQNFKNIELIRPLYLIKEKDIIEWRDYSGIYAMDCACTVTKRKVGSQRREIKNLIEMLKKTNPNVEQSIFKSGENIYLDAVLGYRMGTEKHSFLEEYGTNFNPFKVK